MWNLILVVVFFLFSNALIASVPGDSVITKCNLTPSVTSLSHMPETFNKTNNLRRYTGSFTEAQGKKIAIYGRVMDKNCVPITDLKINMWQANSYGMFQNSSHQSAKSKRYDQYFVGSGTSVSNNMGYFHFLTIIPGKTKNSSPHLNIMIRDISKKNFSTNIFFDDINNKQDPTFKSIPDRLKNRIVASSQARPIPDFHDKDNDKIYFFDIVLDEKI